MAVVNELVASTIEPTEFSTTPNSNTIKKTHHHGNVYSIFYLSISFSILLISIYHFFLSFLSFFILLSALYLTPKSKEILDLTDGVRIYDNLRANNSLSQNYHVIYVRNTAHFLKDFKYN